MNTISYCFVAYGALLDTLGYQRVFQATVKLSATVQSQQRFLNLQFPRSRGTKQVAFIKYQGQDNQVISEAGGSSSLFMI